MATVVIGVNYYVPYVSGLTNVARDVAEGLAARGHDVRVVASQHDPALPLQETINGVRVHRCPVRLRIGKGVISPSFVAEVIRQARDADVVNLHAPMLEAGLIARRLARLKRPLIYTYQCDIAPPPSPVGWLQRTLMDASTRAAARRAAANVVSSADYAQHSRVAKQLSHNQVVIAPGCHQRLGGQPRYRSALGPHIGFLGRIVEEKGIEYLVDGFVAAEDPDARLLIAGDFANIAGGSVIERVRQRIGNDSRIHVLGFLDDEDLPDFYASLDAFALVSVNSFEAFGIVQVEAMMAGVPAIASDMPGVRHPVRATGFGKIVPPRDPSAVTEAVATISASAFDRSEGARLAADLYQVDRATERYERLVDEIRGIQPPDGSAAGQTREM